MKSRGFTLIELIVVLILVGILAFAVMPSNRPDGFRTLAFRDEVASALRYAQKTATSHRRLACADFTDNSVTLTIAAGNPATVCDTALMLPAGGGSVQSSDPAAVFAALPDDLFFQPDGRITSEGAGATTTDTTLNIDDQRIAISGGGGYVQ